MHKSVAIFGLACCLCTAVSAGTLKAAAAEAISESNDSKFEARGGRPPPHGGPGGHEGGPGGPGGPGGHGGLGGGGGSGLGLLFGGGGPGGWGSSSLHGNESFGGPTVIALALPIAIGLIIALWVAAYNTLRAAPPKVGYNAGVVESAGWGGNQLAYGVSSGYGYADAASADPHAALASNLAASSIVQAAATQGATGAVAAGRALDNLTHRVTRSIERYEIDHSRNSIKLASLTNF